MFIVASRPSRHDTVFPRRGTTLAGLREWYRPARMPGVITLEARRRLTSTLGATIGFITNGASPSLTGPQMANGVLRCAGVWVPVLGFVGAVFTGGFMVQSARSEPVNDPSTNEPANLRTGTQAPGHQRT